MIALYPAAERGHAHHGWLESFHSFSFADYFDPARMGWGNLRVINDDYVAAHRGFGMHGHRDMEIVTYMLEGTLTHQDSLGHTATLQAGEVQRMTAGLGVRHSEMNRHDSTAHLLQIWLLPSQRDLPPSYEQHPLSAQAKQGQLHLVGAPRGSQDAASATLQLNADVRLWAGCFEGEQTAQLTLDPARKAYVHVARGQIEVNGQRLQTGDALALSGESLLSLQHGQQAEVLVFDLAP